MNILFPIMMILLSVTTNAHKRPPLSYKKGQILVKTVSLSGEDQLSHLATTINATVLKSYSLVPGLRLYQFDENIPVHEALSIFQAHSLVEYAEPNYYVNIAAPNDPRFIEQWALENNGQSGGHADADINATSMWAIEDGSESIVIGVIDTGVDYNHADLIPNLWRNNLEIPNNNIDEDNNGYIDDIFGVNTINNTGNPFDDHKHGTHVTGTIGAAGNNALGVTGVAQKVKIASCKFLSVSGSGTIADAIKCMQYFAHLKTRANSPVNIVATNNSWGSNLLSVAFEDTIKAHQDLNILFVAAAGNASTDNDSQPFYPATYDRANIISVGATDHEDKSAHFSNFGKRTVHISAPGLNILSTTPNQSYSAFSGTSMAAPHVSGLVAVIKARFPSYDYKKIKNLIISSGTELGALSNTISGRRLRGADTNGTGALSCNNQRISARLKPFENTITITRGQSIILSALRIKCHLPLGEITLFSSTQEQIVLKDSGAHGDITAGDGVYSLSWTPLKAGTYTLNYGNGDTVIINVLAAPLRYRASPISYSYEAITGSSLNASDESIHTVITPFPIRFNNSPTPFSKIYVGSNGTISFSTSINPGHDNKMLPTTTANNLVAAYWDDLNPIESNANIFIATTGSVPNRKFIVEWRNVKQVNSTGVGTFQTVFFEQNSHIQINYADTDFSGPYNYGLSATIGIQTSPSEASQYSYNQASVLSPTSILFRLE
jgi:subtilisin family serine protease